MIKLWRKNTHLQYEFLPAALEIAETPPPPLGRAIIWLIFFIVGAAILWSYLGRVDEVAVARGKIVPDGRLKVVQPLEEGIVTSIHVNEGQQVTKGQLLIELDSTMKKVDVSSIGKALDIARLERDLLKQGLAQGDLQEIVQRNDLPDEIKSNLLKLTQSKEEEYEVKKEASELVVLQTQEQLEISRLDLQKMESNLVFLEEKEKKLKTLLDAGGVEQGNLEKTKKSIELLREDEAKYKKLYESGAIAKNEWLTKYNDLALAEKEVTAQQSKVVQEQGALELNWKSASDDLFLAQKELSTQKLKVQQMEDKLEEAKTNRNNLDKERATATLNLVVEEDKKIAELEGELVKAEKSIQFQSLVSPVDGTVHGLVSNTIGGVVTPAQPIMTIVPEGTPLVVEASLLNKDVGFVAAGQEVSIKVDTFPFQKYGTLKGKVQNISADAFEDEKLGSVYKMRISLEDVPDPIAGQESMHVSPGMALSAEIKTGKRRIIEFFLEPVLKYAKESLNLR